MNKLVTMPAFKSSSFEDGFFSIPLSRISSLNKKLFIFRKEELRIWIICDLKYKDQLAGKLVTLIVNSILSGNTG
jgi:hypothetical protein